MDDPADRALEEKGKQRAALARAWQLLVEHDKAEDADQIVKIAHKMFGATLFQKAQEQAIRTA
jgi:hypothetical protein